MTWPQPDPIVHAGLRVALGALFGWAAVHKLRDRAAFRAALGAYALLPTWAFGAAASLIVAVEIGLAVSLLWPSSGRLAALAAAVQLAVYAAAVAVNLRRGRTHIDCGCVGAAERRPISWALVARNLGLGAVALCAALPPAHRQLYWVDGVTLTAGVCTLAVLYAAADRLLAYAPRCARLLGGAAVAFDGSHG